MFVKCLTFFNLNVVNTGAPARPSPRQTPTSDSNLQEWFTPLALHIEHQWWLLFPFDPGWLLGEEESRLECCVMCCIKSCSWGKKTALICGWPCDTESQGVGWSPGVCAAKETVGGHCCMIAGVWLQVMPATAAWQCCCWSPAFCWLS